jgi:hypothetical protein
MEDAVALAQEAAPARPLDSLVGLSVGITARLLVFGLGPCSSSRSRAVRYSADSPGNVVLMVSPFNAATTPSAG